MNTPPTTHAALLAWVRECADLTQPDAIHWCDGSRAESDALTTQMLADGTLIALNQSEYPGCYLHRSNPNDVARVEQLTFICSENEGDAGPTNHWMSPDAAKAKLTPLFEGCMRGRTMYVVPYVMGPVGSAISEVGVEITDSAYVVASMRIMTRMGDVALRQLGDAGRFVPGLHSVGECDPERRYICHFPETRTIWSYGSGYGGNALLGKKCFALRIASVAARDEGWMAEHMLILELTAPDSDPMYMAAAFPSGSGKTNLAMLVSPLESQGYTVRTVGDDIAWMKVGADGRLWAVNPEAGFFGIAPGTNESTNPHAMATIRRDTIFTNVAVTPDGLPWWEGMTDDVPPGLTDWLGKPYDGVDKAAHPNSRFCAPVANCPSASPYWEDAQGVPISAILFGGRRNKTVPLVAQSFNWQHGVFVGATMGSRTTAAAVGQTGVLRRDPMAMLPFCGYHMGDYFAHWLKMGSIIPHPPMIFQVNWFRKDADGTFLWPGYGDNIRALLWIRERVLGRGDATETPIGFVPTPDALNLSGLNIAPERLAAVLSVPRGEWRDELPDIGAHLAQFGDRLPQELQDEYAALRRRLA